MAPQKMSMSKYLEPVSVAVFGGQKGEGALHVIDRITPDQREVVGDFRHRRGPSREGWKTLALELACRQPQRQDMTHPRASC